MDQESSSRTGAAEDERSGRGAVHAAEPAAEAADPPRDAAPARPDGIDGGLAAPAEAEPERPEPEWPAAGRADAEWPEPVAEEDGAFPAAGSPAGDVTAAEPLPAREALVEPYEEREERPGSGEGRRRREPGPNWMLAFVCGVAGLTSAAEALSVANGGRSLGALLQNLAFTGYALLALGLFAFMVDALQWGRRRGGMQLMILLLSVLLTLAGVACLYFSHAPGRRI